MTDSVSASKELKIDGRRIRRGKRGKYARRRVGEADLLERYVTLLIAIMVHLGIPEYRCKKSNHLFSYHQKIVLLILRQRLRLSYLQFTLDLPSYGGVTRALGLSIIPHHTTLIRFAQVVDEKDLENVICAFQHFCKKDCVIAVDCTGFSNFLRSAHFAKRCKEFGKKEEPRSFTKGSFAVDIETHLILSARYSPTRKHDTQFIPDHVRDLAGLSISFALFDKGYDSEPMHKFVRNSLNCTTVIPCRKSRGNRGFSTRGFVRKQMLKAFEEGGVLKEMYKQRPQVETSNYMVKTHNGSQILSRLPKTRVVEGLCKSIAHNCKIATEKGMKWDPSI